MYAYVFILYVGSLPITGEPAQVDIKETTSESTSTSTTPQVTPDIFIISVN